MHLPLPTLAALALTAVTAPLTAQDLDAAKATAREHAIALESDVRSISSTLWEYSETALREQRSAAFLVDVLTREGFDVATGVAEMPTAFIASFGSGRPIVGVLAEYDALPGVGNAATPFRQLRDDGVTSGQGCGHNLFAAGSVVGAIALKRTMEALGIQGTVRLYGTPAEETVVGKVYMAKAGAFDDLDAAIEWHPDQKTQTRNQPGLAMNNFQVEFVGQAAHAAADPWNGRSALDAVELMNYGVNLMREHVRTSTRIHYVMPSAGEAPNVVPEYAKVWYYVRDADRANVEEYYDWILKIAEGAALATRTTHSVTLLTGVHETLLNRPLQEAMEANLQRVGAPDFSDEDHAFARRLQSSLQLDTVGLQDELTPLALEPEAPGGGSTDVAEVSYITPTVGFSVTTAADLVPWHSWATSASHGTDGAIKGAATAAELVALMGIDLLLDADLLARAREAFASGTGGRPYQSPVPADQSPLLPEPGTGR